MTNLMLVWVFLRWRKRWSSSFLCAQTTNMPGASVVLYGKCPYFSIICVLPPPLHFQLFWIILCSFQPSQFLSSFLLPSGFWLPGLCWPYFLITWYVHISACIHDSTNTLVHCVCSRTMRQKSRAVSRNVCTYSLIFSLALLYVIVYAQFLKLKGKSYCQNLQSCSWDKLKQNTRM
jgi:hypothetical protein